MKILVIDCDACVSRMIAHVLGGHEVCIEDDSTDGLAKVARAAGDGAPYDLVICELAMRGLTGAELIAALQAQRQPPICVLMSAYEQIVEAALMAEDVLMKPLSYADIHDLVARAQAHTNRRRARPVVVR